MDLSTSGFAEVMRGIVTDVVRAELLPIKVDIAELKADVAQLKVDVHELKGRVIKLETGQEGLIQKYEMLVVGQDELNQKYELLNKGQESLMASMADVSHDVAEIKQTLGQHSQQLSELRTGQTYLKTGLRSQSQETARLYVMLEDLRDYIDIREEEVAPSTAYVH